MKFETYGLIERKPKRRIFNGRKLQRRICYQYSFGDFQIKPKIQPVIKCGPKNCLKPPINQHGFNDEPTTDH